jgi:hypothetical protein
VDVNRAATLLRDDFDCDATMLAGGWRGLLLGPVQAVFGSARRFPRLSGDTMRPQFVKLLVRWEVVPSTDARIFVQPFSARLAWLLLHYGALNVLSDVKQLNFNGPVDRPMSRIAAAAIMDDVLSRVNHDRSRETQPLRDRFSTVPEPAKSWLIKQEVDTTMWRMAREVHHQGSGANWKGQEWRWKFDRGTATRL